MSYIGPVTRDLLNSCIRELKKKDNKDKINKHIIEPVMYEVTNRCFPYLMIHLIIQIVIIVMLIYIFM